MGAALGMEGRKPDKIEHPICLEQGSMSKSNSNGEAAAVFMPKLIMGGWTGDTRGFSTHTSSNIFAKVGGNQRMASRASHKAPETSAVQFNG